MTNLRERQKESRRRKILQAAREQLVANGFEATTIETIAEEAEVSAVTVYNYYGTKTGLLLALVSESDSILLERMQELLKAPPDTIEETFSAFAEVIRRHALSFLTKAVWRQVIAASIIEGDSQFGRSYAQLDRELARQLTKILEKLRERGGVSANTDLDVLGDCLFQLQNARFLQFVSSNDMTNEAVDRYLREDIEALLSAYPG
ncbi:TetR/AcrR family transcriptional regulator [Roseibium aggregatum]|uniref:TetR/AcrR family transcriptional regulator n=1 Tax=Roseibium aggregatum TaxID=187304 RepID=A0A926S3R4_9HYPH|nr:TetR/AcrR family transcriptional regulator [Roseibium aggregatum]MBD1545603.1 TetR/AcrR family transcriptional regulator [Roseibium aggregatum]